MVQLLVATITVSLLIFTNSTTKAKPQGEHENSVRIARDGCPSKCGNVSIPFPFGIGSNHCFHDKWFEVVCNAQKRPFLKQIHEVEILGINITSSVLQTRNPVTFVNCPNRDHHRTVLPINLTGSPFAYSVDNNRLAVFGCDTFGYLDSNPDDARQFRAAGCSVNCVISSTSYCETIIPSFLTTYDIQLEYPNSSSDAFSGNSTREKTCSYAFVVDKDWFLSHLTDFDDIQRMEHQVPVSLKWDLYKFDHPKVFGRSSRRSYHCFGRGAYSSIDRTRVECLCSEGYGNANPYLLNGCQDIDECAVDHAKVICSNGTTCVNTEGSFYCEYKHKARLVIIGIGSGIGALVLLLGGWGLYGVLNRRKEIKRKEKFFKQNGGLLLQQHISSSEASVDRKTNLFNSNELEKATDHFNVNRILGQGGQGTVYKGMLADGKIIAVKKSKLVSQGKIADFVNEVVILSQINHQNVVKLLGCCLETEVPLLVYEYIPNGTLYSYIHCQNEDFQLTWEIRIRIATQVAGALSYLHSAASTPIYHRDIKSTNILLDAKYRAKIADFGTSRSVSVDQTHLTTLVSGTFGYMDPEYFRSSQFTEKSDVYSFGVVILELLSGQKPVSITSSREGRSLATCFIECVEENRVLDIVDARIAKEGYHESIAAVAKLAYRCLNMIGRNRPTMKEVAAELEGIKKSLQVSNSDHEPQIFESSQEYSTPKETDYRDQYFASTPIGSGSCSTAFSLDASTVLSSFNTSM